MPLSDWRYFGLPEFSCRHCGKNRISHQFVDALDELRHEYGKPMLVTSGYRCPEHNNNVSSTGFDGPHTTGQAADIAVRGADARRLLGLAIAHGFTGIGVQQKGNARFIHLDTLTDGNRPWVWSY
jgi:zinc D-Ala-D-Ala carboxypeptidase